METLLIPIEIRQDETRQSPGRLVGTLLTYETRAGDRQEIFTAGALRWPADGFNVNVQHNRQAAVVRVVPYVDAGAVKIDAALPNTTAGRDAAENVRTGVYTGLSVEFRSELERRDAGLRRIERGFLGGAALVDVPSYTDSLVEVRGNLALSLRGVCWNGCDLKRC